MWQWFFKAMVDVFECDFNHYVFLQFNSTMAIVVCGWRALLGER
ncbi:MAG: hypothetical protein QNK31_02135 [Porticoccus sp.]|nr:hypothetical protein [Porticoccus sp.]